jgi:hypothetical protein
MNQKTMNEMRTEYARVRDDVEERLAAGLISREEANMLIQEAIEEWVWENTPGPSSAMRWEPGNAEM